MSEASGKDEGDDTADQPKRPSTLAEKAFAAVEDLETIAPGTVRSCKFLLHGTFLTSDE